MPPDPEADERRRLAEELRESKMKEAAAKEAEAQAQAAAAAKGGKKGAEKVRKSGDQKPPADPEVMSNKVVAEAPPEAPPVLSMDDMPERAAKFDFFDYKKLMGEMKMGDCTVGSVLGAMLY